MKLIYKDNKGFTLIELLVVISIVGLLSSVVLGSLSSARQKAKNAKIVVEMNQLKNAFELYRNDKRQYPSENVINVLCTEDWCWGDLISYLNSELVTGKYISSIPNPSVYYDNIGGQLITYWTG